MGYAFDAELAPWVAMLPPVNYADVAATRALFGDLMAAQPDCSSSRPLDIRDLTIPGPAGEIPLRVYAPAGHRRALAGFLYLHGGGFVFGDLRISHRRAVGLVEELDVVVVSVDYRLAPENPFPAPLEDCYATLTWMVDQAAELNLDLDRIGVGGDSAGGCLSAALTLLCRDRGGPALCFQYLDTPVLDDRLKTPSMGAFHDTPQFDRANAEAIWRHYLGPARAPSGRDVPAYAAPARVEDLSGLPPAFVVTAEFDPLRDEGIEYAQRLVQAGVSTELHLYPGTFHGCGVVTEAAVCKQMVADRLHALRRGLRLGPAPSP